MNDEERVPGCELRVPGTWNTKPATRNTKPETQNTGPEKIIETNELCFAITSSSPSEL